MGDTSKSVSRASTAALLFTVGGCILTAVFGLARLSSYAATSGAAASAPASWSDTSQLSLDSKLPTLLLFLHPHCPCSRATVDELSKLIAHTQGKLKITVLMIRPAGASEGWENTDLKRAVEVLPNVSVRVDVDGRLASAFGAQTSGQTLLYSARHQLLFAGGITESRGHSGDNAGRSAIESIVLGNSSQIENSSQTATAPSTAVFGCPLFDSTNQNDREPQSCPK